MNQSQASLLMRVRQNHAVEHASMHILARTYPRPKVVAHSDWNGFTIYGSLDTSLVARAVSEALARLQAGEQQLSIHPRCGTNAVISGLVIGGASGLALLPKRLPRLVRASALAVAILGGSLLSFKLGPYVQEHVTTSRDLTGVFIRDITRTQQGQLVIHRVRLDRE